MMDKILSNANLKRAALKVRENNGAAGVDGMKARELLPYLNTNREGVKAALRSGTYRPSPIRRVEIPKPGIMSEDDPDGEPEKTAESA